MTFLDDMLIIMEKLKIKIKEKSVQNDWIFVAEEIKNWVIGCKIRKQEDNKKYNNLTYKIQHLYNITKYKASMEKRFVLEFVEPIIIELIKLTEKKKKRL